jgi:hypothetical protein
MNDNVLYHSLFALASSDFGTNCPKMVASRRVNSLATSRLRAARGASTGCTSDFTTVRLNVEQNQLVNVFGEFCVCIGSLKSA